MRLWTASLILALQGIFSLAAPCVAEPRPAIALHGSPSLALDFQNLPYANPEATSDTVVGRFVGWRKFVTDVPEARVQFEAGRGITLAGLGQFRAAREVFDTLRHVNEDQAWSILLWPQIAGFAPESERPAELEGMAKAPRTNPDRKSVV